LISVTETFGEIVYANVFDRTSSSDRTVGDGALILNTVGSAQSAGLDVSLRLEALPVAEELEPAALSILVLGLMVLASCRFKNKADHIS
jgi:hypothetical protein